MSVPSPWSPALCVVARGLLFAQVDRIILVKIEYRDGYHAHRLHRTFPQLPTNEGVFRFHSFPKQYSKNPIKPRFAGFA
jgi:hypothetical protein